MTGGKTENRTDCPGAVRLFFLLSPNSFLCSRVQRFFLVFPPPQGREHTKELGLCFWRGRSRIGTVPRHIEMDTEVMDVLTTAILLLRSSLFLSLHLTGNVGSFPKPLSAEEEKMYLDRYAQGDMEARNVLIERNLRLVAHIIKKYYTQTADQEDLISIGTIGLIKGISSYKPEKGVRLATYSARCIENEILMHFRSQRKLQGEVSLSDTLETDKDGNSLFLLDVVGVEDTMMEDLDTKDTYARLRKLVKECLTEREMDIIQQRYGLDGRPPRTQRELAKAYGISRSYVSRIEKRALGKLEQALGGEV